MIRNSILIALAIFIAGCIKPPDDGMALGEQVSGQNVDQVLADAQSGVPETQAFHVGDSGVIESMETVYSSTRLKESDVYKLTSLDNDYFYFDDYKVKADTTTKYKMARSHDNQTPTPTPSPSPTATPSLVSDASSWLFNQVLNIVIGVKTEVQFLASKVTIQTSTALGETLNSQPPRKMDFIDLQIERDLLQALKPQDATTIQSTAQNPSDASGDSPGTSQYFGLRHYKHPYVTANCSQLKDCKVMATHIEFNAVTTSNGETTQVHWVYEVSKEVPGLFVIMSRCGSAVTMINNTQVPFMECSTLDTFHFGAGQTPVQE
jgi:hypothetical protein